MLLPESVTIAKMICSAASLGNANVLDLLQQLLNALLVGCQDSRLEIIALRLQIHYNSLSSEVRSNILLTTMHKGLLSLIVNAIMSTFAYDVVPYSYRYQTTRVGQYSQIVG